MKRKSVLTIIAILILIVGVTVALYPHILRWKYEKETKSRTEDFVQEVRSQNKSQGQEGDKTASWVDLDGLYQEMVNYNQTLYREGQSSLVDAWSYQQESFDLSKWGVKEPSIGYIDLPTMEVRLPIYLGATRKNMELGATHLSQTSMPIGGKNTNSVIAAHRGYYGAKMFQDIDWLKEGDKVYITNFWETLTYEVTGISIVEPSQTEDIFIQAGRDMLTLVTCHPSGVNSHRYLVYCDRVE